MTNYDSSAGLNGGAFLRLVVVQSSQNSGLSQSTDAWSLALYKGVYTSFDLTGSLTWSSSINGSPASGFFTFDFRTTTVQEVGNGSGVVVTHLADGTKTISVSGAISATATSTGGPASTGGSFIQTPFAPSVPTTSFVSRLSHTLTQPMEYSALATTEAGLLNAVQATVAELTLATLPTDLSTAPVAFGSTAGSALDAFNAIIRTEQGYLYTVTTGTVTSPVQSVVVRARQRPSVVTYAFDAQTELSGNPPFIRDVANVAATVTATGPNSTSTTYTDPAGSVRSASANLSESILNTQSLDQLMYAEDRLIRGKNTQLRVVSFTVDALTTVTDRSADLLAMVPGDRIQITNLPVTTLGFSTLDGWLLGGSETHTFGENATHSFELFIAPVLPASAIYDTSKFMADGALTLAVALTNVATSMSVTTSIATTLLETVTFPYTLLIDSEQVTVTACTSAAPQIATITRAVNGTAAAAHSLGASMEIADAPAYYAF